MIYLVLAMACSMLVAVFMRVSEKYRSSDMGVLAANYVMCTALSVAFSGVTSLFPSVEGLGVTLGLGVFNGVLFLAGFVLLQWNISVNGVVLPATFMRLGVLVPTLMAIFAFGDRPGPLQIVGIILALAAIFVLQGRGGGSARSIVGLIVLMLTGGSCDAMSKVFEHFGQDALKDQFLLYTFFIALVLCVVLCIIKKKPLGWQDVLFGFMIGIPNYLSTRFLLLSLSRVPAVVAYPSYSVGAIVFVTVVGIVFFKEKMDRRKLISLIMILAALAMLNI